MTDGLLEEVLRHPGDVGLRMILADRLEEKQGPVDGLRGDGWLILERPNVMAELKLYFMKPNGDYVLMGGVNPAVRCLCWCGKQGVSTNRQHRWACIEHLQAWDRRIVGP